MSLENKSLVQDFDTQVSKALPAGAATIYTDGIDLGHTANGRVPPGTELIVNAPALVVGDLGNGATMTYTVQMDTDSAFGSPIELTRNDAVQTGAGGVGAAAASYRFALPSDCERYVRVKAVNSAAGDASDKSVTANVIFPKA
jgi:hypothetical protein